ncbi:MAG: class I SAM-dependent methyltransferase [Bacillota bacterium]
MNPRAEKIFNGIAPIYRLFFNFQVKYYQKILTEAEARFSPLQYKTVVDVGCGTGALCYVLNSFGMDVTGVDQAAKMLAIADKKLQDTPTKLILASALEPIPLPDKNFDVAISSYTIHGMKKEERKQMYREMARLAKYLVIFHDYNEKRSLVSDILETLEGGNYFDFISNPKGEMEEYFQEVHVLPVGSKAAWYVCIP